MAKKAFLVGCNSGGLEHCETDAALMQRALQEHGYVITLLEQATEKAPYWEFLKHLQPFLDSCHQQDTLIFYFAGHSLNDGGLLKLILADDVNDSCNQLPVGTLLNQLRQCQAVDKLLILDCCRAGRAAVAYDWNRDAGEYFRIYTATSSKETALEVDEGTQGGLFTSWIYRVLALEAATLTDPDGYLRINRLADHVEQQAKHYVSPHGRPAPIPGVYGSTANNIVLTDRLGGPSNPTTGYPRSLLDELKALLARHPPTTAQVQRQFAICRQQAEPPIPSYPTDDLNRLVDYLARLYYRPGNRLPLPLASFVAGLNKALTNPPDLCAWLARLMDWLGQHVVDINFQELADLSDAGAAVSTQTPYLLLEIAPQAGSYHVYCYWQDDRGEQKLLGIYEYKKLNMVPQILEETLTGLQGPRPCLELFLPKALLTDADTLAQWEQLRRPRPLPVEYTLSLRCWERLRRKGIKNTEACGDDLLRQYWPTYANANAFHKPSTRRCADWLRRENQGDYIDWIHSTDPFIGLHFPLSPADLDSLLDAGAAFILWPRREEGLSRTLQTVLDQYFSQCCLGELPHALRKVRENLFIKTQGTGDLSLLWDDPNRVPEQADRPLDEVPLAFPT